MPVTMEQVRAALDPEEPDYEQAAKLGPEALPHLERLISRKDPHLASKAASLAGMIDDERAARVVEKAAKHEDARVRVAAAYSAQYLSAEDASRVLTTALSDRDVGVQKVALKSVPKELTPELRSKIEAITKRKRVNPAIQNLSREVLARRR
jgi:HEAT repeat protein